MCARNIRIGAGARRFSFSRSRQDFHRYTWLHLDRLRLLTAMDLSLDKLREAISLREQIDALENRLSSLFGAGGGGGGGGRGSGGGGSTGASTGTSTASGSGAKRDGRRRPMSAATRAKIAEAARARWASRSGNTSGGSTAGGGSSAKSSQRKGGITAAGRKKLSDAMKARWAARRRAAASGRR